VPTSGAPVTAQDFRLRGYLAYQRSDWQEAIEHYKAAVEAARDEGEPLRREWQTLRSLGACLDASLVKGPLKERKRASAELTVLRGRLGAIRRTLTRLPHDANLDDLVSEEVEAERKVAKLFVEDINRDDVDGTTRMGDIYGAAARWLGAPAVPQEWIGSVCLLVQSGDADLAQYAAWTVGEWIARGGADSPLVGTALQAAAADPRVRVQANGLRGLVVLERVTPISARRALIEGRRSDPRIAIHRALAGEGAP
jgi:hypothetical protein